MKEGLGKKRNFIYLAGSISNDPRTYEWREEFTELISNEPNVVIVNPCKNRFNETIRNFKGTGLEFIQEAKNKSQFLLRPKDRQMIKISNLMIANIGLVSEDKPLIGTVQELCWARDFYGIPVIGLTHGVINAYTEHPWVRDCISAWAETVEESVELVRMFFLEY